MTKKRVEFLNPETGDTLLSYPAFPVGAIVAFDKSIPVNPSQFYGGSWSKQKLQLQLLGYRSIYGRSSSAPVWTANTDTEIFKNMGNLFEYASKDPMNLISYSSTKGISITNRDGLISLVEIELLINAKTNSNFTGMRRTNVGTLITGVLSLSNNYGSNVFGAGQSAVQAGTDKIYYNIMNSFNGIFYPSPKYRSYGGTMQMVNYQIINVKVYGSRFDTWRRDS